jgi:tetrahydromethanopterin S-methyltransferase subunit D
VTLALALAGVAAIPLAVLSRPSLVRAPGPLAGMLLITMLVGLDALTHRAGTAPARATVTLDPRRRGRVDRRS